MLAQLLLCALMCAALVPENADGSWVPILSDQMVTGSLLANESLCYRFHMDDATTKQAVQWTERRKPPSQGSHERPVPHTSALASPHASGFSLSLWHGP